MIKKLKILHLLSQRPDSTGSGFYIQAMLKESEEREHDNYLLAGLHSKDIPDIDSIDKKSMEFVHFGGNDISYDIVGMSDVMPYESRKFCDLTDQELDEYETVFSKKIEKIISENRPDIIHSHHLWILTSLVKLNFPDIPVVASCHGSDIRQFRKCTHLRDRVLSGVSKVDALTALSGLQKNEISELYGIPEERIHVVGAGFNEEIFLNAPKPDPSPVSIVYAGKLSRSKGVPWMLKALFRILDKDWKLHLVGSGTGVENDECLELARKLGDKVIIHGSVHQKELAGIMSISHIFILPSFFEGLPLVVLEALASGCRVIATDLQGIREIVSKTGEEFITQVKIPRLCSVDEPFKEDEDEFIENLKTAISEQLNATKNKPDIIGEGINLFTWSSVFERVQEVYRSLLT